jgi:hypothetical protein
MDNIFVSRPTWVAPEFKKGLESFLKFLEGHDLRPRTLGASDYPSKTPLDDIISLIDECIGIIVLGYPQIYIEKGILKDNDIKSDKLNPFLLPTEWNHIEAGLAYARGLPMLIIHHVGVKRGIFDRGAINSYIYEIDLADDSWPLLPQISGAFNKWKKDVLNQKAVLKKTEPKKDLQEFKEYFGVLLKILEDKRFEEIAYCPSCKLALAKLDKRLICSKCGFIAPYGPANISEKIKALNAS